MTSRNPNLPVDLRLLDYVSEVDRNLSCPICHCPFIEPLRLSCDHTFCRHCLTRTFQNQTQDNKTCPTCRAATNDADALPVPRFLIHLIEDLCVRCPKHEAGCSTQMRRADVQSHVDHYCEFTDVACPGQDCRMKVPMKFSGACCPHTIVSCNQCKMQVMEGELATHLQKQCTKQSAQCQSCHEEMLQRDLGGHILECSALETQCCASKIGCKFISNRAKTKQHESSCTLAALAPTWQVMSQCVQDQAAAIKVLQRRNDELETGFSALQNMLGSSAIAPQSLSMEVTSFPSLASPIEDAGVLSMAPSSMAVPDLPPFDSATHHLLSLHESLREEVDRLSGALTALDAKFSMMLMNESLRNKEDMTHTNAIIGSMRMQLQWLTSARLQALKSPSSSALVSNIENFQVTGGSSASPGNLAPIRRLSDSAKQDLKL